MPSLFLEKEKQRKQPRFYANFRSRKNQFVCRFLSLSKLSKRQVFFLSCFMVELPQSGRYIFLVGAKLMFVSRQTLHSSLYSILVMDLLAVLGYIEITMH